MLRIFAVVSSLSFSALLLVNLAPAQATKTPPQVTLRTGTPIAGVHEDFTTPALTGSDLKPTQPLVFLNDYPDYTMELLRVQWRPQDPIDLYVMKPKGVTKPPVILYLYGYPSTTDVFKRPDYQKLVTRNGVAAVGFVSALTGHRYHDRPMKEWFISDLQECLATSAHDVQMVLNYLASRGDLDMDRVGMFTQGSGASIAILASEVDPRIKVLEAMDPWGDWPTWMQNSPLVPENERPDYVKPEFLSKVAAMDPVNVLPKIQAKKFRLDDQMAETATPRSAVEKMRNAVPPGATVLTYKNKDEFKAAFEDGKNLDWIKHELESVSGSSNTVAGR